MILVYKFILAWYIDCFSSIPSAALTLAEGFTGSGDDGVDD